MSIPVWTYDASFYEEKTLGTNVYIKTDPIKGKGLFARKALKKGSPALIETAMCCTQNRDDFVRNIPVCGMCLVSVETPRGNVARVTKNKTLASEIPYNDAFRARSLVRCKYFEAGCPMVFCSTRCQEHAWEKFHYCGCRGRMSETAKASYDQFLTNAWQQGGVDYSDTHYLAMRFLTNALTLHRLHKHSLEQSFAHIGQLIKAPIHKFSFSFLLRDDDEFAPDVTESKRQKVLWKRFQQFKDSPTEEPFVKAALESSVTKDEMLQEGEELLRNMFGLSEQEAAFFLGQRWSELLGAVLLNGQERTPHSPFYEHVESLSQIAGVEREIKAYTRKIRSLGYDYTKVCSSSNGQGIYTIGCLFNHSCSPNLQVLYVDENDETLIASCLRDIEPDEELCISYINEDLHFSERQQQLYEHYLFTCTCTKCEAEKDSAVKELEALSDDDDGEDSDEPVVEEQITVDVATASDKEANSTQADGGDTSSPDNNAADPKTPAAPQVETVVEKSAEKEK